MALANDWTSKNGPENNAVATIKTTSHFAVFFFKKNSFETLMSLR